MFASEMEGNEKFRLYGYTNSLRASFKTIPKLNGADDSQIMQQIKHRTRTMIDRYTRVQQVMRHNAAMKLGL